MRVAYWTTASLEPRYEAVSREVMDLCRKVRPLAVDLVNAFGIPEPLLRAEELLSWE